MRKATAAAHGMPTRAGLIRALEEGYRGPWWVGASLRQLLRRVPARRAARPPAPGRNAIWDLALHLALTRHIMLARLTGERTTFPRPRRSSWWARRPGAITERAWREDQALLEEMQRRLIEAIRRVPASRLTRVRNGRETIAHELLGAALHDAYHAGQIGLLAKLVR